MCFNQGMVATTNVVNTHISHDKITTNDRLQIFHKLFQLQKKALLQYKRISIYQQK